MSGWTGDISAMGRLADNLAELAEVPSRASKKVSENIADLIEAEFASQSDPYGNPWEDHADATIERHGPHPILSLSGAMRSTVHVAPMAGAGVSVTIDHPSEDHQTGWSGPQGRGPARPILPSGDLPDSWALAIDEAVDSEVRSTLRRSA